MIVRVFTNTEIEPQRLNSYGTRRACWYRNVRTSVHILFGIGLWNTLLIHMRNLWRRSLLNECAGRPVKTTLPGRRVIENWSCLNESTPVDLFDVSFSSLRFGSAFILVRTIDPVVVAMCRHIRRPMPYLYPFITDLIRCSNFQLIFFIIWEPHKFRI